MRPPYLAMAGSDHLLAVRQQLAVGARLVDFRQPAVADDVHGENSDQLMLWAVIRHQVDPKATAKTEIVAAY